MRKLLRMGLIFARVWRGQAVCIAPAERLTLRRLMATAGKKGVGFVISVHGSGQSGRKMEKRGLEGLEGTYLRCADVETSDVRQVAVDVRWSARRM